MINKKILLVSCIFYAMLSSQISLANQECTDAQRLIKEYGEYLSIKELQSLKKITKDEEFYTLPSRFKSLGEMEAALKNRKTIGGVRAKFGMFDQVLGLGYTYYSFYSYTKPSLAAYKEGLKTLGLKQKASQKEIRARYHELAQKYNPNNDANIQDFLLIKSAYDAVINYYSPGSDPVESGGNQGPLILDLVGEKDNRISEQQNEQQNKVHTSVPEINRLQQVVISGLVDKKDNEINEQQNKIRESVPESNQLNQQDYKSLKAKDIYIKRRDTPVYFDVTKLHNIWPDTELPSITDDYVSYNIKDRSGRKSVAVKMGNLLFKYEPGGKDSFTLQVFFGEKGCHNLCILENNNNRHDDSFKFEDLIPFELNAFYADRTTIGPSRLSRNPELRDLLMKIRSNLVDMALGKPMDLNNFKTNVDLFYKNRKAFYMQQEQLNSEFWLMNAFDNLVWYFVRGHFYWPEFK